MRGKRTSALVRLLFLLPLFAAACAPTPTTPTPTVPAAQADETPKYGGRVAYTATAVTETLNPYKATSTGPRAVLGPIYESLLSLDYQLEGETVKDYRVDYPVRPMLAESWQQTNDTTYVFTMRRGVKWHDGADLTAADVVFSYDYLRDIKNAFPLRGNVKDIDKVELVDPHTVRVSSKGPAPALLMSLADPNVMILPKHVNDRGDDFAKVAVGTGPFKYKAFDRTGSSLFVRNEGYWQAGRPYMDGVEVFYGMDQSARLAAFVSKKADLRGPPDKVQFETLVKQVPDAKYATMITTYGDSLLMKLDAPPFEDLRVRRALHLAVDRQALLKAVGFDIGIVNPPGMPGVKTGWAVPQEDLLKLPGYRQPKEADIAEAKRLLSEAGYPAGLKTVTLVNVARSFTPRIAEGMAGQLRQIGVDMEIRVQPTAEWRKATQDGQFETYMDFVADAVPANYQFTYLHSKGTLNKMPINDPRLDELIDKQAVSLDVGEQKRAALEMQRLLIEKLYVIPTIEVGAFQVWQPWVRNYIYNIGTSEIVDQENAASMWLDVEKMPADRR